MATEMQRIKETANAHMLRDFEAGRKWICVCEPCREMRSLVGMEKLLHLRPLVREIEALEAEIHEMPAGPELQARMQRYLTLYDQLAEVMAT